jgi:hypothetical protein
MGKTDTLKALGEKKWGGKAIVTEGEKLKTSSELISDGSFVGAKELLDHPMSKRGPGRPKIGGDATSTSVMLTKAEKRQCRIKFGSYRDAVLWAIANKPNED